MATSGTVSFNEIVIETEAMVLEQLTDVTIGTELHNNVLTYNEVAQDAGFVEGFVNKDKEIITLGNFTAAETPVHDQLLVYHDNTVDSSQVSGWSDKTVSELLGTFQVTVEGLVAIAKSKKNGETGNPGLSDMVAFTDSTAESGFTMAISSCGDNNVVFKRELLDTDFIFMGVLSKGQISNLSYGAGTIFRSTKGLTGFSAPFPMPMGLSSLSDTYFRFYAFRHDVFVFVTSAGLETVVTLYASDGSTIVDGPTTISPYGSATFACNANSEFIVTATESIYCGTYADHTTNGLQIDQRLLPPMSQELILWNRQARITAQETNTTVTYYRRDGVTGTFTVQAGTPLNITGTVGSTADFAEDGCLILRADKPISGFSGADSQGWEAIPAWPLNQVAQLFSNPANMDNNADAGRSSVTIASQYEGTATIYDTTGTVLTTFAVTRGAAITPATTVADQLFPAAGQFQPLDIALADWLGGYVEVNVPSICIMNFNGGSVWTSDAGDEMLIPGVTPDYLSASIITDANGLYRRRDIDASGVETWNIC